MSQQTPSPSPVEQKQKGTVLLVEDDVYSATALRTILTRIGWQVTSVASIREAMLKLAEPFDYLILDLMLPDGDGLEVLTHVRQVYPKCRIAITTGVSDPQRLKKVASHDPGIVLMKPIDLKSLLKFLETPTIQ